MVFRMPFVAPRAGFDLFGNVERLRMSGLTGDFVVGASALAVPARSQIILGNVEPLRIREDLVSTSVAFDIDFGGSVNFQAMSEFELNGESVHTGSRTVGELLGDLH